MVEATQARAQDDRAHVLFVRDSWVSTLCPVSLCPYLRTSGMGAEAPSYHRHHITYHQSHHIKVQTTISITSESSQPSTTINHQQPPSTSHRATHLDHTSSTFTNSEPRFRGAKWRSTWRRSALRFDSATSYLCAHGNSKDSTHCGRTHKGLSTRGVSNNMSF